MRTHLAWASATLALVISAVTACGSSSATSSANPSTTCINASAPHHAYVVVEHLSGSSVQRCVGFATDTIDASTLMDSSGIEYQTQTFSFGKAVCQIDHEPAQFSDCLPQNQPYWSLFLETNDAWAVAQTGYAQVALRDKEALGWHYVQQSDPSPAPPPLPALS